MNYRMISYVLFFILRLEGLFMLLPVLIGFIYGEINAAIIYLICAAICFLIGFIGSVKRPKDTLFYQKEGFVTVALCWIIMSLFGAVPFVLTGDIPSYVDAVFEIVSGFTTTGASIAPDVEAFTHATLFWRSFSHWLGGMGVLVFALMIIPAKNGSNMNLMRAESPGPDVSKFVPRVRDTAVILYKIYIAMTLIQIALLLLSGMKWFDTVCISLGTAGTGGFSVLSSGCASYTPIQQWIITIFMILFGINFTFYYLILYKKVGAALRMEEVRAYIFIILGAIAIITINTFSIYGNIADTLRHASFQVGSIITTTGYATVDFNLWPSLSKCVLILLMFLGACAGSTGGGLKVSRFLILVKCIKRDVYRTVNPKRIKTVQMDGKNLNDSQRHGVAVYFAVFILIFAVSLLIVSIDGFSFESNFTAIAATFNNIGPGLDAVGPMSNFAAYSPLSKIVMIFDMLAGRLEIFPILILFNPSVWRKK